MVAPDDDDDDDEEEEEEPVFDTVAALVAYIGTGKNALNALHFAVFGSRQRRGRVRITRTLLAHVTGDTPPDRSAPPLLDLNARLLFGLPSEFERAVGVAFANMAKKSPGSRALESASAHKVWYAFEGKDLVAEIVSPQKRRFEFVLAFASDD